MSYLSPIHLPVWQIRRLYARTATLKFCDVNFGAILEVSKAVGRQLGGAVQGSVVVTCAVDARWIAARLRLDLQQSNTIQSNISDLGIFETGRLGNADVGQGDQSLAVDHGIYPHQIVLPQNWLESQDSYTISNGRNTTRMISFLDKESNISQYLGSGSYANVYHGIISQDHAYPINRMLSTWVGAIVADLLARYTCKVWYPCLEVLLPGYDESRYVNLEAFNHTASFGHLPTNDALKIEVQESRYGYGYGFNSDDTGTSVKLAIAVLGIYILVVVFHLAAIFIWRYQGSYKRNDLWGEIQGLVILGVNSDDATSFHESTSRSQRDARHRLRVRIREGDRLAFVFGDDIEELEEMSDTENGNGLADDDEEGCADHDPNLPSPQATLAT